jgi:hypothetical protein
MALVCPATRFAPWLDRVLVTIALPCIAAAFHLLYVVHLIAAKVRIRG